MKKYRIFFWVLGCFVLTASACRSFSVSYTEGVTPQGAQDLPKDLVELTSQLDKSPRSRHPDLVKAWQEWLGQKEVPLKEGKTLTFIWVGSGAERVSLESSFNNWSDQDFLYRWKDTDLWYKSFSFANTGVIQYRFRVTTPEDGMIQRDRFRDQVDPGQTTWSLYDPDPSRGRVVLTPRIDPPAGFQVLGRELMVYLPPEYRLYPERRFPVLYVLDGQNAWDSLQLPYGGWKLNTTLESLVKEKKVSPLIVVGILPSRQRREEYLGRSAFYKAPRTGREAEAARAEVLGTEFATYVTGTIKPWIDSRYRTRPGGDDTAVAGASLGGAGALTLAITGQGVFSKVLALGAGNYTPENDPVQWKEKPFRALTWLEEKNLDKLPALKIYMASGTEGTDQVFLPEAEALHRALLRKGFQNGSNILLYVEQEAPHDESAWARFLPEGLKFLFSNP